MTDVISDVLNLINETLTAAIVVLTVSFLLYNLTRNLRNRVARTSAIMLACVTVVSLCDALISLRPSAGTLEAFVRLQWIGIATMPTALFHLSDALLATTGLPSRGRRRRAVRGLYLLSVIFVLLAAFSDMIIRPMVVGTRLVNIVGGGLFLLYVVFFLIVTGIAFITIQRARSRCLTRDTRRRMAYLQFAMLTPAFGIFPYSVLFGISETGSVGMLLLVNLSNLVIIFMLLFLAYPLSFFGSHLPDRVVKTDLLRFVLRGPATGLLVLGTILFITPATRILGLPGNSFMPFAVVAVVLVWQWSVALALPWLEKRLIYSGEDDDQLAKLQSLSDRLLTRADLLQLLDAILSSTCDFLQVSTAFVASLNEGSPELVSSIGPARPNAQWLEEESAVLRQLLKNKAASDQPVLEVWHSYWITPLYSSRSVEIDGSTPLIGFLGIQARSRDVVLSGDEWALLGSKAEQAAETLDDMALQSEIYAALEGLLPQIQITRTRAAEVEYRPGREGPVVHAGHEVDREQFIEQVRAALRHYWGGPGLSSSRLLELRIVHEVMNENGENPARALRAVLQKAIENQRPEGERKMLSPEWTIYNILEERFIEKRKVREVAIKLALSEPDLYRKQRVAIEAVADTLMEMESASQ